MEQQWDQEVLLRTLPLDRVSETMSTNRPVDRGVRSRKKTQEGKGTIAKLTIRGRLSGRVSAKKRVADIVGGAHQLVDRGSKKVTGEEGSKQGGREEGQIIVLPYRNPSPCKKWGGENQKKRR